MCWITGPKEPDKKKYTNTGLRHDLRDRYLKDIFCTARLELWDQLVDHVLGYDRLDAIEINPVQQGGFRWMQQRILLIIANQ